MTFIAKYDGLCAACSDPIEVGDKLQWTDGPDGGRAVHVDCAEDIGIAPEKRPTCPKCWEQLSVSGACACEPEVVAS